VRRRRPTPLNRSGEIVEVRPQFYSGSNAPDYLPKTLEQIVGTQVRAYRKRRGITGEKFAREIGISTGMLSKIETGRISASLQTLRLLAQAMDVPISTLFATYEERRDCSYVAVGRGVTIERRGTKAGHRYQLLGHALSGALAVEPYLITLSREAKPYGAFQHEGQELIHMLTGRIEYRHGEATYLLNPGDTLFFDSNALHGPIELPELPATYLSIIMYKRGQ